MLATFQQRVSEESPRRNAEFRTLLEQFALIAQAEAIAVFRVLSQPKKHAECGAVRFPGSIRETDLEVLSAQSLGLDPERKTVVRRRFSNGAVFLVVAKGLEGTTQTQAALCLIAGMAERDISASQNLERNSKLSARHVERRERELLALSTKIHNELSQSVTLIRLGLASVIRQLAGGPNQRLQREVEDLVEAAKQVSESIIELSNNLRPPMIETLGPAMALRQEAKRYQASSRMRVECELEKISMDPRSSLAAFRIAQESLANISQHANADIVRITLTGDARSAILTIQDNGCGFDPAKKESALGLAGMIQRAELAGGSLHIESSPGAGTRIKAVFPIPPTSTSNKKMKGDQ